MRNNNYDDDCFYDYDYDCMLLYFIFFTFIRVHYTNTLYDNENGF
jgi:hypothetical protein